MPREFEKHAQLECVGDMVTYSDDYCQIVKQDDMLKMTINQSYLNDSADPQKTIVGLIEVAKQLKTL